MRDLSTLFLGFIIFLSNHHHSQAVEALCLICENGVADLKFPYSPIDNTGTTCTDKHLEVATYPNTSRPDWCTQQQGYWRPICCGSKDPSSAAVSQQQEQVQVPKQQQQQQQQQEEVSKQPPQKYVPLKERCELCWNGNPNPRRTMVINIGEYGAHTCTDYYELGQRGGIDRKTCSALQVFAFEPCGCDQWLDPNASKVRKYNASDVVIIRANGTPTVTASADNTTAVSEEPTVLTTLQPSEQQQYPTAAASVTDTSPQPTPNPSPGDSVTTTFTTSSA